MSDALQRRGIAQWFLIAILLYFVFLSGLGLRSSAFRWISPQYIDEIAAILLLPFVVWKARRYTTLRWSMGWLGLFVAVGAITGYLAGYPRQATLVQILGAIKMLVFLLAPVLLFAARGVDAKRVMGFTFWTALLSTVAFEAYRFLSPQGFLWTVDQLRHIGVLRIFDLVLPRAYGVFFHPSHLAMVSAAIFMYYWATGRIGRCLVLAAIILTTGQIMEIGALVLLLLIRNPVPLSQLGAIFLTALIAFSLLCFAIFGWSPFVWLEGLVQVFADQQARNALLSTSIRLAVENLPLGVGFGGFGGVGAALYNPSVYFPLGFSQYWWFASGLFLMDSSLAQIIGETGVIGTLSLVYCFVAIVTFVTQLASPPAKRAAGVLVIYPLAMTVASISIYETVPLVALGLAIWALTNVDVSAAEGPAANPSKRGLP